MNIAEIVIYPIPGFSEPVSCFSHLLGAGVFAVLYVFLLRRGRGHRARILSLSVFALSCILLLSLSGVYHLLSPGTAGRHVLQRLDHAAIFVLIAGTFTPVHGILFKGIGRWGMIILIWTAAITGITLKTIFFTGVSEWLSLTFYLGLGWIGALSGMVLYRRYGFAFIRPLVWGALAYTAGAVLEFMRQPILIPGVIGPHELFHAAVLTGAAFHWKFVYQFADGGPWPKQST